MVFVGVDELSTVLWSVLSSVLIAGPDAAATRLDLPLVWSSGIRPADASPPEAGCQAILFGCLARRPARGVVGTAPNGRRLEASLVEPPGWGGG